MVQKNVKSRVWIQFGIFRCNDKGYIKYGYGNKGIWLGNTKKGYIKDMGIVTRCRVWGLRHGEFKSHAFKGKWI